MNLTTLSNNKPDNETEVMRGYIATKPAIKAIKNTWLSLVDTGLTGITPLKLHTVITGFPRGGTTLLQAMISTCVANSSSFGHETWGLLNAAYTLRNNKYLITKRPNDVYWINEIREYYLNKRPAVNFIMLLRDPRAVLTSKHHSGKSPYYVDVPRWLNIYEAFLEQWDQPDTFVLRYEDLITRTDEIQQRLIDFTGWIFKIGLKDYHLHLSKTFDDRAMHGARPIDSSSLEKWKQDTHRERIRSLISAIPDFSTKLIKMGYEEDDKWERLYS